MRNQGVYPVFLIACEQALLFGRVKRVWRERASERQSRKWPARLTWLTQIGELARRLVFWLSSGGASSVKEEAACELIGTKKGAIFSLIYFFKSFCIYYIPHNYVIPQAMLHAIPQAMPMPFRKHIPPFTLTGFSKWCEDELQSSNPLFKVRRKRKTKSKIQICFSMWCGNEKWKWNFNSIFPWHWKTVGTKAHAFYCFLKEKSLF